MNKLFFAFTKVLSRSRRFNPRKIRSDARIRTVEKRLDIGNILRNTTRRNTRSDEKLGNFRKDWGKK